MTELSSLIRAMAAAGAPAEAIALAVEAIETASASQRTAARDRKRRQRARERAGDEEGVTVTGPAPADPSPGRSLASPDPSTPPNPPTRHTDRRGAARLPGDWMPAPLPMADAAMVEGWPAGRIERELARFRDHWRASGSANARKRDWDAAWRNWLRESDDRPRLGKTKPRAGNPIGDEPTSAMVRAGLARLRHAGGA